MSELGLRLRFWLGQLRGRKVRVDGHQIFVPPGVLDPVLFRSGAWFSEAVAARLTGNERLLDLGCGSGVVGLVAQARGARVTAVDISAPAVAAARDNGLVDVRQSDLFEAVEDEFFDVVAFNPPYFPGGPRGPVGKALYGGGKLEVIHRFRAEVDRHLVPVTGRAWLCWSDRAPEPTEVLGATWTCCREDRVDEEVLSLWEHVAPAAEHG